MYPKLRVTFEKPVYHGDSQTERRDAPRYISKYCFLFINVCVLFFQTANKLLGQVVITFFGPNYLIK